MISLLVAKHHGRRRSRLHPPEVLLPGMNNKPVAAAFEKGANAFTGSAVTACAYCAIRVETGADQSQGAS